MELTQQHRSIVKVYLSILKRKGMYPTRLDMMKAGYNRDKIRHYFSNLNNLQDMAREMHPEAFEGIIDETLFTPEQFRKLVKRTKKFKRFVITTAVTGCEVHDDFMHSIQIYCEKKNAMLLVLPCSDPAAAAGWVLDPEVGRDNVVFSDLQLNSNIFLSSIKLSAKHIDPVTSLDRIGQRNGTFIYASPKQRLKYVSVGKKRPDGKPKYPHAVMTTGAITKPNYFTQRYMSERTAYIANHDHVMGAIILEIEDDKHFHFRQIQAEENGSFVDLGEYYQGDKVGYMNAAAVVAGDWHSGQTDPSAAKALSEICSLVKPEYLVIHDGFNGRSINHHEKYKRITRAVQAMQGFLLLEEELKGYAKDLDSLAKLPSKQVVIVKSNHDIFLDRWLDDGDYTKDPYNLAVSTKLADAMIEGKNPLRVGVEMNGLKATDKVRWLEMDEDFSIARIQMGAHGHKGPNGAKGSLKGMEKAYGQSVNGHAHTPEILRGAFQVGTNSLFDLGYNDGPSSWLHTDCIVYPNGARQLINKFNGNWRLR